MMVVRRLLTVLALAGILACFHGPLRADYFKLEPSQGYIGTEVTFSGHSDTVRLQTVSLYWPSLIPGHPASVIAGAFADANGDFAGTFSVPYGYENGTYAVSLRAAMWDLGSTTFAIGPPQGGHEPPPDVPAPADWGLYQGGAAPWGLDLLSDSEGWAVTGDSTWFFNGAGWFEHTTLNSGDIYHKCIRMLSPTDGWVGCANGKLYHWDGQTWQPHTTLPLGVVAISGVAPDDVWALVGTIPPNSGSSHAVYHWNGAAWSQFQTLDTSAIWVDDIEMVSPTDGWAILTAMAGIWNYKTLVYRYNGATWTKLGEMQANLTDLEAVSANDVWAVGLNSSRTNRTFTWAHWNGATWSGTNTSQMVSGQWDWVRCSFADASHGWAGGGRFYDFLAKYESGAWSYQSYSDVIKGIEMRSPTAGWMVGGNGFSRYLGENQLQLIPAIGAPGQRLTAKVAGFTPSTQFWITWETPPDNFNVQLLEPVRTDAAGSFETDVYIPLDAAPGTHRFVLSTRQYVQGEGLRYLPITYGQVTVQDGLFYAIAAPDTVYLRLGGWPGKDASTVSTTLRARVSTLLPPEPAGGLPMTAKVQAAPAGGCTVSPAAGQTDGDGYFAFQVTPSEGDNLVAVCPATSPQDVRTVRVVGYLQPPPPAELPPGFAAQAWVGESGALRQITLQPDWGPQGTEFTIRGAGFTPTQFAYAYWDNDVLLGQTHTQSGSFSLEGQAKSASGEHTVTVVTHAGDYATASFWVQNEAPDTLAPAVTIDYPPAGAVLSGTVELEASATDAGGVKSMELLAGDTIMGRASGGAVSASWDTTLSPAGAYYITATARDGHGNRGTATARVTVDNTGGDHLPPNVGFLGPADGAVVNGQVNVSVSATDNVGVASTAVFLDGARLIDSAQSGTLSFTLYASSYPNGAHTLDAVAYDAAGNPGRKSIDITISGSAFDETPPVVTIQAPAFRADLSGTVSVQASATDNSGAISRMSAWVGHVQVGQSTSSSLACSLDTTQFDSNLYNLLVYAYDAAGNYGVAAVPVNICNISKTGASPAGPPLCRRPGVSTCEVAIHTPQESCQLRVGEEYTLSFSAGSTLVDLEGIELRIRPASGGDPLVQTWLRSAPGRGARISGRAGWVEFVYIPPAEGDYVMEVTAWNADGIKTVVTRAFQAVAFGSGFAESVTLAFRDASEIPGDVEVFVGFHGVMDPIKFLQVRLEVVREETGEKELLDEGPPPLLYTWETNSKPPGLYRLVASSPTAGRLIEGASKTLTLPRWGDASLADIRITIPPDEAANSRGEFRVRIECLDQNGSILPYQGDLHVSCSFPQDRIRPLDPLSIWAGDPEPLPYTRTLYHSDYGRFDFYLAAKGTGNRVITVQAENCTRHSRTLQVTEDDYFPLLDNYAVQLDEQTITHKYAFFWWTLQKLSSTGEIIPYSTVRTTAKVTLQAPDGTQTTTLLEGRTNDVIYRTEFGEPQAGTYRVTALFFRIPDLETIGLSTIEFVLVPEITPLEITIVDEAQRVPAPGPDRFKHGWLQYAFSFRSTFNPIYLYAFSGLRAYWSVTHPSGTVHSGEFDIDHYEPFYYFDLGDHQAERGVSTVVVLLTGTSFAPVEERKLIYWNPDYSKEDGGDRLEFEAGAPALLSGPDGQVIGNAGDRYLFDYIDGNYYDVRPNSGSVPLAAGDRVQAVADAARLLDGESDVLEMKLQRGDQARTLTVARPDPIPYVLDFTAGAKGSRADTAVLNPALCLSAAVPTDRAWSVAAAAPVTLHFTRAVDPATLTIACTPDPGGWSAAWNSDHTRATLSHTAFAADTDYTFHLTNAATSGGLAIVPVMHPLGWTFSTVNGCQGTVTDFDQDGYVATGCGGDDTDDNDPEVNPGETEVRNGRDDNSNGQIDEGTDGVPPAPAADLTASYDVSTRVLQLHWTATGEDGYVGAASAYDARYRAGVMTESSWYTAAPLDDPPIPQAPGAAETLTAIIDLPAGVYEFALRTGDAAGNWSALSNTARLEVVRPTVRVVTPAGGEVWLAGSAEWIVWTTIGDIGQLRIEFSPDGGASWQTVAGSAGNSGAYEWAVPATAALCGLIRISELDGDPVGTSGCFRVVFPVDPDGDGEITADDLLLLGEYLAENLSGELEADLDGNGVVDVNDLLALTYLLAQ